jgi:superfamily II DNA helicase RecQ
MRKAL